MSEDTMTTPTPENKAKDTAEEVEEALQGDAVGEVCVLGRRVRAGRLAGTEEVCAVVVPPAAARALPPDHAVRTEDDVRRRLPELCRHLSPHKWPTRIVVREQPLPRSSTAKV